MKFSKRRQREQVQKEQGLYMLPASAAEGSGALSLDDALQLFVMVQSSYGHSRETEKGYRRVIGLFVRYMHEEHQYGYINQVTEDDILEWRSYLRNGISHRGRPYSSRTIESYNRAVTAFFNWLAEHGHLRANPMDRIKPPKVARALIRVFTENELQRLDAACDRTPRGKSLTEDERKALAARDRAFLWLLLSTGVRVSEACGLLFSDIDWNEGLIYIRGKGAKERRIPFGKIARQYLDTYIRYWRGVPLETVQPDDTVFLNVFGNPLGRCAADRMFARLKQVAGITDKRVSPHTCRHWFAVNAIKNGMPTIVLKNILGHESWEMIEVYVRLAEQDVKESYVKFSPVDTLEMHKSPKGKRAQLRAFRAARRKGMQS